MSEQSILRVKPLDSKLPCYDCGNVETHDGSCRYASSGDDTDPVLDSERVAHNPAIRNVRTTDWDNEQ